MNTVLGICDSSGRFSNSIISHVGVGSQHRMKQPTQTIEATNINTGMVEGCGKGNCIISKSVTGSGPLKRKRKSPLNHRSKRSKRSRKIVTARNPGTPRMGKEQKRTISPRGIESFRVAIKKNPKYRTMKKHVEIIARSCVETERCPICSHRIEIDGRAIRTAIDHLHEMEDHEVVCAFRALLCQRCNTTEGQALKESIEQGTDHVEVWMRKRFGPVTPKSKEILRPRMEGLLAKGKDPIPCRSISQDLILDD